MRFSGCIRWVAPGTYVASPQPDETPSAGIWLGSTCIFGSRFEGLAGCAILAAGYEARGWGPEVRGMRWGVVEETKVASMESAEWCEYIDQVCVSI